MVTAYPLKLTTLRSTDLVYSEDALAKIEAAGTNLNADAVCGHCGNVLIRKFTRKKLSSFISRQSGRPVTKCSACLSLNLLAP